MRNLSILYRNWCTAAAALALPALVAVAPGLAAAQDANWPTKAVRIIVPFAAGTSDLVARLIGQAMSEDTGQPFVVENKVGAGGAIGSAEVATAAPDGYTLLLATASTHAVAPSIAQLPYDTVADFTPIAHIGDTPLVILLTPHLGITTLPELIELARKEPGSINYASNGPGTIGHLTFEMLSAEAGITMTHIPYKGSGLAIPDVASGLVQLSTDVPATGSQHIAGGRVLGLAVTGAKRSASLPDVPTVAETLPGFNAVTWFGLYGPKGMSPELTERIHDAVFKAMQTPAVVERFNSMDIEPGRGSAADFGAMAARDTARWREVVKERNIVVQ